jgi:osmotically-inducible protein OsmY
MDSVAIMKSRSKAVLLTFAIAAALLMLLASGLSAADKVLDDQSITDAVENELVFDPAVPSNDIVVTTDSGIVTLTGTVDNVLARDRAAVIAETVKGVRSVVNLIEVHPRWNRMDWEIENDARNALLYDHATDSYQVEVSVKDNVATLTGTVDSWQEKELCGTIVAGVKGIVAVQNDIVVQYGAPRTDPEILAEIQERMRWDVLVDQALIEVAVDKGDVTLTGTVGSLAEKEEAARDAWVSGVNAVDDSGLEVKLWARDDRLRKDKYVFKPDKEIKAAVEGALIYDPRVLSSDVTADVKDGMVTLRGEVETLEAKRSAGQVARNTVGVVDVDNRIRIRPPMISDQAVADNIESALGRDPYIEKYDITVSVIDGVAYLDGTVDSYFEKGRADDDASSARGVEQVVNNLKVNQGAYPLAYNPFIYDYNFYDYDWYNYKPDRTFQTDEEIESNIESELFWSPYIDADDISVSVVDGIATLDGTVHSWPEFYAATENAYQGGAIWVRNEIDVE